MLYRMLPNAHTDRYAVTVLTYVRDTYSLLQSVELQQQKVPFTLYVSRMRPLIKGRIGIKLTVLIFYTPEWYSSCPYFRSSIVHLLAIYPLIIVNY